LLSLSLGIKSKFIFQESKTWGTSNEHWINSSCSYWSSGTDFSSVKYSSSCTTKELFTYS